MPRVCTSQPAKAELQGPLAAGAGSTTVGTGSIQWGAETHSPGTRVLPQNAQPFAEASALPHPQPPGPMEARLAWQASSYTYLGHNWCHLCHCHLSRSLWKGQHAEGARRCPPPPQPPSAAVSQSGLCSSRCLHLQTKPDQR